MQKTRIAVNLVKRDGSHPWQAVDDGLTKAGFRVTGAWNPRTACDLVVTWNSYGQAARAALEAVSGGATHVVLENGYLRHDRQGRRYYLAELGGYSGQGRSIVAAPSADRLLERFDRPVNWTPRSDGHVLICGQMGGDYSPLSMPLGWVDDVCRRALDAFPSRQIVWRPHPVRARLPSQNLMSSGRLQLGNTADALWNELRDAWRVIVWTSNAATDALWRGVPVIYEGPSIKMKAFAAKADSREGADGLRTAAGIASIIDRSLLIDAFAQVAWDQWTLEEIAAGEPFASLA